MHQLPYKYSITQKRLIWVFSWRGIWWFDKCFVFFVVIMNQHHSAPSFIQFWILKSTTAATIRSSILQCPPDRNCYFLVFGHNDTLLSLMFTLLQVTKSELIKMIFHRQCVFNGAVIKKHLWLLVHDSARKWILLNFQL